MFRERTSLAVILVFLCACRLLAQDPLKVSAKDHAIVLDNDQVRVLRVTLGPHQKTTMHSHPESVAVFLSDVHEKITALDGKTHEGRHPSGGTAHSTPVTHVEENLSDQPIEFILVELKKKPAGSG